MYASVPREVEAELFMPTFFRAMFADGEKPQIGLDKKSLGALVGDSEGDDIPLSTEGHVRPGTGGMSVAPGWRQLPYFRIPKRLKALFPAAAGSNNYRCWRTGEGGFEAGPSADGLCLRPDPNGPETHGFIEPAKEMTPGNYQAALAATRDGWVEDEA